MTLENIFPKFNKNAVNRKLSNMTLVNILIKEREVAKTNRTNNPRGCLLKNI